jgi:hypothetical protein
VHKDYYVAIGKGLKIVASDSSRQRAKDKAIVAGEPSPLVVPRSSIKDKKVLADWDEQNKPLRVAVLRTATLKIDNCLDCPHSERVSDPGSPDPFDMSDQSLCCRKTPYKSEGYGRAYPGRIIVACERSEARMREDAKVPEWCPLIEKGRK